MNKRYVGAFILSPLVIVLFLGGIYLKLVLALFSFMGIYEFYNIFTENKIKPIKIVGYIVSFLYYCLIFLERVELKWVSLIFVVGTITLLTIIIFFEEYNIVDAAITYLGIFYVAVPFSLIALISEKSYGNYFVWIIFISCWVCDSLAYYTGRFFGKTKLIPRVSPKKTVEGAVGGLIGSVIAVTAFGFFIQSKGIVIPIFNYVVIGILGGVICQLGDLAASSIKRYVGAKDYSNLIPGHGGILDRFDSILFTSVLVYYYVAIILGM